MIGGDSPALLVVLGPTAAGKTDLAIRLARELDGEVVSADSMQVYRRFDVGTAKPTVEERLGVPHHLIDVAQPDEQFSAARFVELADRAIAQIHARGRRAVVAGGTGLYVKALLHGLFDAPPPDPDIRGRLRTIRDREGLAVLRDLLRRVDPEAANRIGAQDFVRICRALEVFEQTGRSISELQAEHRFRGQRHASVVLGLCPERTVLRERIDLRVDLMMSRGWLQEVRQLMAMGLEHAPPMGALGYRQLRAHLQGELDLEQALRQTRRDTWRFAKRQLSWFRAVPSATWFERGEDVQTKWVARHLGCVEQGEPLGTDP